MEISPAARVGMVVVVGLVLFGLIMVKIGRIGGERGVRYEIIFRDVAGLQEQAPVHLAGVKIGTVSRIWLDNSNQVHVYILVTRPDVSLYTSPPYVYTIASNLTGDKWMEIQPGPLPEGIEPLAPDEPTFGTPPVTLDDLAREGSQVMGEFKKSVAALNDLVADPQFQADIRTTMSNFNAISTNLKGASSDARTLMADLNRRVARLSDSLERVVAHADETILMVQGDARAIGGDLRGVTGDLNRLVRENRGNIDTIVLNLRETSRSLKTTMRAVEELAQNPELKEDVLATVDNLRKFSEQVEGIASDIRAVTSDPKVQADLKETISNVREASASAKRVMGKVEGLVSGEGTGKLFSVDLSQEWNTDNGRTATNLNAYLFPYGGPFTVKAGVDALGTDNLINLQGGKSFNNYRLRGGVVRSQFGVGADAWFLDRRFEINVDAYDTSLPKVDVLGKVLFPGDFFIMGGAREIRSGRAIPVVGAGKRF
jgi:phospholipid/cholesterol/gamma-HCH transport system substrate-binding protein